MRDILYEAFAEDNKGWFVPQEQRRNRDVNATRARELRAMRYAHAVVTVSSNEQRQIQAAGVKAPVFVIGHVKDPSTDHQLSFSERSGVLFVGAFLILSCAVQLLGHMRDVDAPKDGKGRPPLKAVWAGVVYVLRGWSDFWYARLDATVGGVILVALFALSFLPLSYLQSIVLYNRNFGVIIRNKLRRAEFLDSLLA